MINLLINNKFPFLWILLHVILGILCTYSAWPLIVWFYLVMALSFVTLLSNRKPGFFWLACFISYLISFEILARMAKTSPIIPYESGKYFMFVFLILGILSGYRKGAVGWVMLVLLIPGLLIDKSGLVGIQNIIGNALGPVNVALAIIFFRNQSITKENFISILRILIYPLISVLAFVIIKTPDLDVVNFKLGANFQTAGGFGSNQVSTALGLGMFLSFLFWNYRWTLTGYRILDGVLVFAFAFRGLLTFSRGGMIVGAIAILMVMFMKDKFGAVKMEKRQMKQILLGFTGFILLFFTFQIADDITGGKLMLRYQGETSGTLSGKREKSLNMMTSNRLNIAVDDINLWLDYPFLGAGVGASKNLRERTKNVAPHVEMTRLLSEHGIPGLLIVIIFIGISSKMYDRRNRTPLGTIQLALFAIAFITTFHAATRTYVIPLLLGLSMISVFINQENHTQ